MPNTTVVDYISLTNKFPPSCSLSPLSLCGTGGETGRTRMRNLMGQDRYKVTAYQLPLWAKQTQLGQK